MPARTIPLADLRPFESIAAEQQREYEEEHEEDDHRRLANCAECADRSPSQEIAEFERRRRAKS
jgi:hypothetical protein